MIWNQCKVQKADYTRYSINVQNAVRENYRLGEAHSITVIYGGDNFFDGNTSNWFSQVIK